MACIDWKDIRKNFRVDALVGLYVKVLKDTTVYINPVGNVVWEGWKIRKGQTAGMVYSWVDSTPANPYYPPLDVDGLFIMFQGGADTNYKPYYIKLEKNLLDWDFVKAQLDDNRKNQMNYYELMFQDIENNVCQNIANIETAGKIAIAAVVGYFVFQAIAPLLYIKFGASELKNTVKSLK